MSAKSTAAKAVHVLISGHVQGVYFRQSLKAQAEANHVTGWTRNLPSGHVEVVLCGKEADVDAVVSWCRTGPPAARVTNVAVTPCPAPSETAFVVRR